MKLPNYSIVVLFVLCCAFLIIAPVSAHPIFYEGNGHYYQAISAPGITWSEANSAAQSLTYKGVNGHLATMNSEGENSFIAYEITSMSSRYYWIGGFQPAGSTEPDGGWQWVNGDEWSYTDWRSGEPDNLNGVEDRLAMISQADEGSHIHFGWNDFRNDEAVYGYIVEWDATPTVHDLINNVDELGLPNGIEQGLLAKLDTAEKKIAQEQYTPGRNTLNAFINQVNAQRGKALTGTQADELIVIAQEIINSIPGK